MNTPTKLWNKNYILLLQGSLVSMLGDVLYALCISYWVYEKTQSTALMGTMSSITMCIVVLLSPFAGSIVDRSNRKHVIVGMDALRGIMMIAVGIAAYMSKMTVPMVIAVAVGESLCSVLFSPASTTVFADILAPKDLIQGQSIASGGSSLIQMIGKSLSGMLIVAFGVPTMILINGISYIISAITECFIDIPQNAKEGTKVSVSSVWADIKDGLDCAVHTRGLNVLLACVLTLNMLGAGLYTLALPLLYEKGLDIVQIGYVSTFISLGGLVSMLIMGMIHIPTKNRAFVMNMGLCLGGVFIIVACLSHGFWMISLVLFVSFIFNGIGNAIFNASMILAIPREKRGVVFGFLTTVSYLGQIVSTMAYGFLGEFYSLSTIGVVCYLIAFIPVVVLFMSQEIKALINRDETEEA